MEDSSVTIQPLERSLPQLQQPATNHVKFFAGDLSFFCTEKDLHILFSPFGHVQSIHIPRTAAHGESLMHGFVHLEPLPPFTAEAVVDTLNGQEYMGRHLNVQISTQNGQRNPISKDHLIQVHMSFISKQAAYIVNEAVLRGIFTAFGEVADISIKKHAFMMPQNFQSGYGFVYFYDVATAQFVVGALKGKRVDDVTIDCSMSFRTDIIMKNSQSQGESRGVNSSYKPSHYSVQAMTLAKGEEARRYKQQQQQQQQLSYRHNHYHQQQPFQQHFQHTHNKYFHQSRPYPRGGHYAQAPEAVMGSGYQYHHSQHSHQQPVGEYRYHQRQSHQTSINNNPSSQPLSHRLYHQVAAPAPPLFLGEMENRKYKFLPRSPSSISPHNVQQVAFNYGSDSVATNGSDIHIAKDDFALSPTAWSTALSPTMNTIRSGAKPLFSSMEHSSSTGSGTTTEESVLTWSNSYSYSDDHYLQVFNDDEQRKKPLLLQDDYYDHHIDLNRHSPPYQQQHQPELFNLSSLLTNNEMITLPSPLSMRDNSVDNSSSKQQHDKMTESQSLLLDSDNLKGDDHVNDDFRQQQQQQGQFYLLH